MAKRSAGLLLYRKEPSGLLEVLLVHPGGPFWMKRDDQAWSIPKGEYEGGDEPIETAEREFAEELGHKAPEGDRLDLGELKQTSGKRIRVWAVAGDFDVTRTKSNSFEMQWPPGSGMMQSFPEIDRAAWFPVMTARNKLSIGQVPFLDRLTELLRHVDNLDFFEGNDSSTGAE
ncbi:MAG: NUDIX domain-containing protein [Actinomycetota bacterium]|nr:MAG: NUDIX domain-containing protein [Actinomycetota bacterium]